jgi:hypothetical protein
MRLVNRKLGALAAGTLAVIALTAYSIQRAGPSSSAPVGVPCHAVDANGTQLDCLPFDPARVGFAAMRGM